MNRFPLQAAVAWLLLFLSPGWLASQSRNAVATPAVPVFSGNEQGSFKILFGGEVIGQEKYQIVGEGSNFKASGEVRLTVDRGAEKATFNLRTMLQCSKTFEPVAYQILQESGNNKMRARVNFKSGMSQAVYETGRDTDSREIELKKDVLVLDDNVFHHYIILIRRFDFSKGGTQEFNAFVPQQFIAGGMSVEDKGLDSVSIGDKKVSLQHLLVDTGELQLDLWVNERHELQKISVPKSNVDVVRE